MIDSFAQSDEDIARVSVVDTTAPALSVSLSPAQLWPPDHKLIRVRATIVATDTCDATEASGNQTLRQATVTVPHA